MTSTTPTFTLTIYTDNDGTPGGATLSSDFDRNLPPAEQQFPTEQAARDFAASLPKSRKISGCRLSYALGECGSVHGYANLASNGVNGGVNETGVKRLRAWLADPRLDIHYEALYGNSYPTLADALAALGA